MTHDFHRVSNDITAWFTQATDAGWLPPEQTRRLEQLEAAAPADLFAADGPRPLVVAFFGGTGVGKSSLLNRLAGAPLARTGVERPTSHEVTLYLHRGVRLERLPPNAPTEHVRVEQHERDAWREVLWVDAPDIDSVEQANRELALAWLPYVDLLVYVVSPERYRDDLGWQVLRERRARHGWVFVINQWDAGAAPQRDDFARLLAAAGFERPAVLCTSCATGAPPLPTPDEFAALEDLVRDVLAAHGLSELERLGYAAKLRERGAALHDAKSRLGSSDRWRDLAQNWEREWRSARDKLREGLDYSARVAASRFAVREGHATWRYVGQAVRAARGKPPTSKRAPAEEDPAAALPADLDFLRSFTWDDWADGKVAAALANLEVGLARAGVTPTPVLERMRPAAERAAALVSDQGQDAVRRALVKPGRLWQRITRRCTGFLMAFLPVVALMWVAYTALEGFYRASRGEGEYLGTPFAINAALIVFAAWAVPYLIDRQLRPSVERTVLEALREGLERGLDAVGDALGRGFEEAGAEREELIAAAEAIEQRVEAACATATPAERPEAIRRIVADAARPLDAGALTQRG